MGHPAQSASAILAQVTESLDAYNISAAERLLAGLLADGRALAAATPEQRCRIYLDWGWIHGATQRYETARQALGTAVEMAETLSPRHMLCEALRESAVVAKYEGDFRLADSLLERSEIIARQEGYDLELGQALFLRATIAHLRTAFAEAHDLLLRAAAAAERTPPAFASEQLRADICRERAVSAKIARDYDAARDLLTEARDRYSRLGLRVGVANAERELGAVLSAIGDPARARQHYAAAFSAYLRTGRRFGAALAARRIGSLDMLAAAEDRAMAAPARRRFVQALRLGGGDPDNAALITLYRAQLARLEGDLDMAERLLDEAVQRYTAIGETEDVARDLSQAALQYGMIASDHGDRATAISLFRQALAPLREADDPDPASLAHYHLASELIQAGEVADALSHAVASFRLDETDGRRLRDPADRRSFYQEHRETYVLAMHCAARAGDGHTALTIAMAARSEALTAFIRAGVRLDPRLRELVDEITLVEAEATQRPPGQDATTAGKLEELYTSLEHQTSRQMRQTMTGRYAEPEEIIATLPAGGHALLLDVLEEDDTICNRVWVSQSGEIQADEVIFPVPVRHFLDSYHHAREGAAWRPQSGELGELGQAVLPPGLAAILDSGANPPLIISTGNLLGAIPVAALRVNERYLAEQAQLALVPSMALWGAVRSRPARRGHGTLAFIDSGLPSSRREEAALLGALSPVHRVGPGQLRAGLADASRYAAVVISAHGTPPEAGETPGGRGRHTGLAQALALGADDRLTAAQLLTCHLPDALITPSCWSGRLTIRTAVEPFGLPTAALAAGARWVLAGTVDIGDPTTASLMSTFYKRLKDGLPAAAALQQSQAGYLRSFRPRPRTPPGTWAGLAIVGDGFTPLAT
jgi:CHAT domain-containing protein/uncharacterized protein